MDDRNDPTTAATAERLASAAEALDRVLEKLDASRRR